ncbi:hypothetical protein F5B21DRAFT_502493 [Xylaria acuta]|nr:hypothetical protein F5B21DRAFT_502493 [Xylaria acuta]
MAERAWLGRRSSDSRLALSTLEYLGQQVQYTKDAYHFPQPSYAEPNCVEPDCYRPDCLLPYSAEIWTFQNIWSRPWFNRLWVLQEIHLAGPDSVMKCGDDEILWSSFRRAIICICNKDGGAPEGAYMLLRSLLKMCGYAQADPFELLIWKHHNRQCVNDRDRIYGPMSLVPSNIAQSLTINYQLRPWEVYKQVVLAYLATKWKLIARNSGGAVLPHYLNTESDVVKTDPCLDETPVPAIWEPLEFERTREDPKSYRKFRNRETGEAINSDLSLCRDALKARGINIKQITVV